MKLQERGNQDKLAVCAKDTAKIPVREPRDSTYKQGQLHIGHRNTGIMQLKKRMLSRIPLTTASRSRSNISSIRHTQKPYRNFQYHVPCLLLPFIIAPCGCISPSDMFSARKPTHETKVRSLAKNVLGSMCSFVVSLANPKHSAAILGFATLQGYTSLQIFRDGIDRQTLGAKFSYASVLIRLALHPLA